MKRISQRHTSKFVSDLFNFFKILTCISLSACGGNSASQIDQIAKGLANQVNQVRDQTKTLAEQTQIANENIQTQLPPAQNIPSIDNSHEVHPSCDGVNDGKTSTQQGGNGKEEDDDDTSHFGSERESESESESENEDEGKSGAEHQSPLFEDEDEKKKNDDDEKEQSPEDEDQNAGNGTKPKKKRNPGLTIQAPSSLEVGVPPELKTSEKPKTSRRILGGFISPDTPGKIKQTLLKSFKWPNLTTNKGKDVVITPSSKGIEIKIGDKKQKSYTIDSLDDFKSFVQMLKEGHQEGINIQLKEPDNFCITGENQTDIKICGGKSINISSNLGELLQQFMEMKNMGILNYDFKLEIKTNTLFLHTWIVPKSFWDQKSFWKNLNDSWPLFGKHDGFNAVIQNGSFFVEELQTSISCSELNNLDLSNVFPKFTVPAVTN